MVKIWIGFLTEEKNIDEISNKKNKKQRRRDFCAFSAYMYGPKQVCPLSRMHICSKPEKV